VEARIARLESDVAHLRTDVADIKIDVRGLHTRMDERIDRVESKIGALDAKFDRKLDFLKNEISSSRTRAVLFTVALAAGLFSAMARGFGWL
jgi:hypothetical protein